MSNSGTIRVTARTLDLAREALAEVEHYTREYDRMRAVMG